LKLATFRQDQREGLGIVWGERLIDLNKATPLLSRQQGQQGAPLPDLDMKGFLSQGPKALEAAQLVMTWVQGQVGERSEVPAELHGVLLDLDKAKILAPISDPPKILCLARNYVSHIREVVEDAPLPKSLLIFMKPSTAVIGPGDSVVVPPDCKKLDHEVELAVVIGKKGRHIPKELAMDHVAGYTVFNDISDRGYLVQEETQRVNWFAMKAQDSFAPMGPWISLKDEIKDPHRLRLRLWVNGELRQDSTGEEMVFKIPQIVSELSRLVTLEPGDVIATGTPTGTSFSTKKYLAVGDVVECEIQGIGLLRNSIEVQEPVYRYL
jgi:2-keto-4-pentenoate hydratase/2-oxohepta-3-ene-1,7-dioic acid hydratase in catechol pathway